MKIKLKRKSTDEILHDLILKTALHEIRLNRLEDKLGISQFKENHDD